MPRPIHPHPPFLPPAQMSMPVRPQPTVFSLAPGLLPMPAKLPLHFFPPLARVMTVNPPCTTIATTANNAADYATTPRARR
uniref:Uncharacterized protein n=1 Tax=Globodera rostochiensis TaxID=31243 RepID=A0A914GNY6_GLORO